MQRQDPADGNIGLLATLVKCWKVPAQRHTTRSAFKHRDACQIPHSSHRPPGSSDPVMRRCLSPRQRMCWACIRTRSVRGARPDACATTGSTSVAIVATGWSTSSVSSQPPRRIRPRASPRRASRPGSGAGPSMAADRTLTDSAAGVDLLADLAEIASFPSGVDAALDQACHRIRVATGAALVGIWEVRPGGLVSRATDVEGPGITAGRNVPPGRSLFSQALESSEPIHARPGVDGPEPVLGMGTDELVVRIPGGEHPWGVLVIAGAVELGRDDGHRLARAIARTMGVLIQGANASEQASGRLRRAEALRRVATDLTSRLDVGDVVRDLSDHARVLFGADRVAVVLHDAEGRVSSPGGTGFSDAFLDAARALEVDRLGQRELPSRRPVILVGPDTPRSGSPLRAAAIQEGVDTLLSAPLVDGHEIHGMLYLAHDRPHRWRQIDLDSAEALAGDAAIAVRSARTFGRMATWAAQLQSIQRLGSRLSGLTDVREIGHAIATELRQLIDYQNVRVYRVHGKDLMPVAMMGHGTVYSDETVESLRVEIGEGVTGWVAKYRVPQLVDDTANDPRAITIPGSEPDIDESMLLAPMVHEGVCLGVLVLSKLGLRQFTEDDLRLLVIYASFAAQAMTNADATAMMREQASALERQLAAQRELLRTTESILTTLDQRAVLEQITDRHGRPDPLRQHRDRGRGPIGRPARPPHRPRHPLRRVPAAVGARRGGHRHLGRGAQRAGPDRGRADRRARQPLPRDRRHRRQPDRRAAARPRGRRRRDDAGAPGERDRVRRAGVRARQAVRRAGLDRPSQRRDVPGGRVPRPDRRSHGPAQPPHVQGLAGPQRRRGRSVRPRHGRPGRVQGGQRQARPPDGRPAPARDRRGAPGRRPRHRRRVPLRRRRVRADPPVERRERAARRWRTHPVRGRRRRRRGHELARGERASSRPRSGPPRSPSTGPRPRTCCSPRTAPASSQSAAAGARSRRRPRASRSPASSRSPSPLRSTRRACRRPDPRPHRARRHPVSGCCVTIGPRGGCS